MNSVSRSPLGEAVYYGRMDVIRWFIIDNGVSVDGEIICNQY